MSEIGSIGGGIGGIGAGPARMLERAQKAADGASGGMQEFEATLRSLEQRGQDPTQVMAQAAEKPPAVAATGNVESGYHATLDMVKQPGGPEKLLTQMESGYRRLNEILGSMQSGRTFTPQQLLGLQGEMHQITLQLETATKVATEVVSGVKQILQTQV